jgi:asparagine synthase (glutamine-hydrolysing)
VCLSGIGGDEWFGGNHLAVVDALCRWQFVRAASRIRAFRHRGPGYGLNQIGLALWVQLPPSLKGMVRRARGGPSVPEWIRDSLAERVQLRDRLYVTSEVPELSSVEQRIAYAWNTNADKTFSLEYAERLNASTGCEERLPFMDRRLVEWALTLPHEQRSAHGETKVVLRNAARQLLPQDIASRHFAPDCSFETSLGLRQIGGRELVLSIAAQRRDWVSAAGVDSLWQQMEAAEHAQSRRLGYSSWVLWLLVGTHLAARAIERCPDRWAARCDSPHVVSTMNERSPAVLEETLA